MSTQRILKNPKELVIPQSKLSRRHTTHWFHSSYDAFRNQQSVPHCPTNSPTLFFVKTDPFLDTAALLISSTGCDIARSPFVINIYCTHGVIRKLVNPSRSMRAFLSARRTAAVARIDTVMPFFSYFWGGEVYLVGGIGNGDLQLEGRQKKSNWKTTATEDKVYTFELQR